jgi:hypothetical protein
MVDASIASTESSNPIGASLEFDPISSNFKDGSGQVISGAEAFRALSGFDRRSAGAGQAGGTTLQRNALFKSLLSSPDARRSILESIRREQGSPGSGFGGGVKDHRHICCGP